MTGTTSSSAEKVGLPKSCITRQQVFQRDACTGHVVELRFLGLFMQIGCQILQIGGIQRHERRHPLGQTSCADHWRNQVSASVLPHNTRISKIWTGLSAARVLPMAEGARPAI